VFADKTFREFEPSNKASCNIEPVDEPLGVCRYFAKQFDCGEQIIAKMLVLTSAVEHL
jgi:hypothetical protein